MHIAMEQFESEHDYVVYQSNPKNRFNWLYFLPVLGVLWLLFLISAFVFQWPISSLISPILGIVMLTIFLVTAVLLFWAMAPRENR